MTFRNNASQTALPVRNWGAFMLGNGVGGGGVHWNAETFRFLPSDFVARSHLTQRYGDKFLPEDMTIQDWGVTYDDLEPHYDQFEYLCGTSGTAGNISGTIQEGGNPFEGARSRPYPTPARSRATATRCSPRRPSSSATSRIRSRRETCRSPTPTRSALRSASAPFAASANGSAAPIIRRPARRRRSCRCCCANRISRRAPSARSRASISIARGKCATGVTYVDSSGEEWEQPADLVLLCAFQLFNVQLLLLSGIGTPYDPQTGQGQIGRNFTHQTMSTAIGFFDKDKYNFNPFVASGAIGMCIDEFNGDNFDHGPAGFVGGGYIGQVRTNGRPLESMAVPPGTPAWGAKWKQALRDNYLSTIICGGACHGSFYSYRDIYLDLDPTYKDRFGRPLMRMTIDLHDNELKMSAFLTDKYAEILQQMGAEAGGQAAAQRSLRRDRLSNVASLRRRHHGRQSEQQRASTDICKAGTCPICSCRAPPRFRKTPATTRPTRSAALAFWSAKAIRTQYLKSPGPLVHA